MKLKTLTPLLLTMLSLASYGQKTEADTVIVPLAETSKIIFTVGDRADLEVLRHYNFQELFNDMIDQLERGDATRTSDSDAQRPDTAARDSGVEPEIRDEANAQHRHDRMRNDDEADDDQGDYDDGGKWSKSRRGSVGQTWQSYNIDLGTNNYLAGDQFPDGSEPYAVRPWGSWYVAGNSVQRTRLGKNIFVEWGLGVSWYSFKFEEDNIHVSKDEFGVSFIPDTRDADYIKSKLSATFINASLVPVLDFSDTGKKTRVWDGKGNGFRFGIGPYVGYRIASKSKLVLETDGKRQREKDRDSFYLNNLRYGMRLQLGVRSTDLFINYDMNDLFAAGKGPKLNAISFGIIL